MTQYKNNTSKMSIKDISSLYADKDSLYDLNDNNPMAKSVFYNGDIMNIREGGKKKKLRYNDGNLYVSSMFKTLVIPFETLITYRRSGKYINILTEELGNIELNTPKVYEARTIEYIISMWLGNRPMKRCFV